MRALLVRLAQAELVEAKTRKADRYALLELEDPAAKDAKSRSSGRSTPRAALIAEVVVGKQRDDAFGAGKGGTYVRKPGDPQTWLASGEIEAPTASRDWIKPQVFDTDSAKISKLTVEIPGEEPLKIERGADKDAKVRVRRPAARGQEAEGRLRRRCIVRAAGSIELEDVRKLAATPSGQGLEQGHVRDGRRPQGHATPPQGAGCTTGCRSRRPARAMPRSKADEIEARVGGWEFKVPAGKAGVLLKRRAELIDDKAS